MANKTFEFSKFSQPAVEREYLPNPNVKEGEGVRLHLNLDHLTLETMEKIEGEYDRIFKELTSAGEADDAGAADSLETKKISLFHIDKAMCRFKARMLGGEPGETDASKRLVHDWNVTQNGKKVPVGYEIFIKMPKPQLDNLYNFVMNEASNPTKKKDKA